MLGSFYHETVPERSLLYYFQKLENFVEDFQKLSKSFGKNFFYYQISSFDLVMVKVY